ncbi:MAG: hypothetical protein ABJC89_25565 [Acidobacteriota bacterium]
MTTGNDAEAAPTRGGQHEALAVFLGDWKAEGTSYGGAEQQVDDPKANGVPWISTHRAYWHTGEFFMVQDEKARPGGTVFDTLSIMGVDASSGAYFARTFENHGFYRHYDVTVDGDTWRLDGASERATIVFTDNDRTQSIAWEWCPTGQWLPLCDRVATKLS